MYIRHLLVFVGFVTVPNSSMHGHGLLNIKHFYFNVPDFRKSAALFEGFRSSSASPSDKSSIKVKRRTRRRWADTRTNRSIRRSTCPSDTLPTTNITWTGP